MASPPPLPLVVPVAVALVEDPVEAPPIVVFPVEADFLLPLTGPVETIPVLGTFASAAFPTSPGSQMQLLAVVGRAQ